MLGRAPLVDFDGTITNLRVDWTSLRRQLAVSSITELWSRDPSTWDVVTRAEIAAARTSEPIRAVTELLTEAQCFAVITDNASAAVVQFLRRFPELAHRCALIVGRERLGGPKRDWRRFRDAFAMCVISTAGARGPELVTYVGDSDYELAFAKDLHALAYSVDYLLRRQEGSRCRPPNSCP